jgi:Lon protease-like protein
MTQTMSEQTTIQVNFSRPVPLFPLDTVALLPQQIQPLHVFEPRYSQMVGRALDGAGQIAMAIFKGDRWKQEYHGNPPLRRAVCIGQIIQHEMISGHRYNIVVQGVCRARIVEEYMPDEDRQYREAMLEPIGVEQEGEELPEVRRRLGELLGEGPLTQLAAAGWIAERVRNDQIPTSALLELVSFTVLSDRELRYRLLDEGDAEARAALIECELTHLQALLKRAAAQHPEDWPKGMSWN